MSVLQIRGAYLLAVSEFAENHIVRFWGIFIADILTVVEEYLLIAVGAEIRNDVSTHVGACELHIAMQYEIIFAVVPLFERNFGCFIISLFSFSRSFRCATADLDDNV